MAKWHVEWNCDTDECDAYIADFGLVAASVFHTPEGTYKWNGIVRTLDGTLLFDMYGENAGELMRSIEERLGNFIQTIFVKQETK